MTAPLEGCHASWRYTRVHQLLAIGSERNDRLDLEYPRARALPLSSPQLARTDVPVNIPRTSTGVSHALKRRYLRHLIFALCKGDDPSAVVEEWCFMFEFPSGTKWPRVTPYYSIRP